MDKIGGARRRLTLSRKLGENIILQLLHQDIYKTITIMLNYVYVIYFIKLMCLFYISYVFVLSPAKQIVFEGRSRHVCILCTIEN